MHLNLYHFPICWFIFSKISFVVIHLNSARVNACTQIDKPPNNVRSKEKWIRSTTTSSPKIVPFLALVHAKRRGIPRHLSSVENATFIFFLSFPQRNVQWSSTTRPLMSRFSSFRVRTPNERFFSPSFVTTRVFAGGKLSCTGIINFSYPRRRASPRFQAHPAWTYFRRSTFFVSRTGRGRGGEERFLTKKRRRWTNEWRKDRGEIVVRRKLNDGITLTIIYDFLSARAVDFLLWNFEEIKRQRFSVRWLPGSMSLE